MSGRSGHRSVASDSVRRCGVGEKCLVTGARFILKYDTVKGSVVASVRATTCPTTRAPSIDVTVVAGGRPLYQASAFPASTPSGRRTGPRSISTGGWARQLATSSTR